jgi:Coenzyme F420-reducing hydrogenase, beta subunit
MVCYNACPFDAISFVETELSVQVPQIDSEKCRHCALCEKVCPVLNVPKLNYPKRCIALYAKLDMDRQTCASGGAATTFSRYFIKNGGVVYGATANGGYPKFIRVSDIQDLELLKGSKYVYCVPESVYKFVKQDLQANKQVLFIGLPCNVAALENFLKKDYDNLFTIDLICHGAPPFAYLREHLRSKRVSIKDVDNITFRGELDFYTTAYDKNRKILYKQSQYEDEYFSAFMRGYIFRPSCYQCLFAKSERISDITVGDFWGITKEALNNYTGKISVALLNTGKGVKLFDLTSELFVWEQRNIEEAINGNQQLSKPSSPGSKQKRELFKDTYCKNKSVTEAFKICGIKKFVFKNKVKRYVLVIFNKLTKNLLK